MNRSKRRHPGKPRGMSYADQLAQQRMLREAAQNAANDLTVQVKADIQSQKTIWLLMLCLNEGFKFGEKSFKKLSELLHNKSEWYEKMVKENDEDYAEEKLRQEAERVTREEIEFAWEEEIQAAKKKHEQDRLTNYERLRFAKLPQMATMLCAITDCQECPGKDLCNHKDGKANGLIKWLQATETK